MLGRNFASRGTQFDCLFVIAVDAWGCWSRWCSENSGCRPLGKLGGLSGQGILKWPRTSSEECKEECPCAAHLQDVGVQLPTWEALAGGVRPATSLEEKHASVVSVQSHHREHVVWPQLTPADRGTARSQSGPLSSVPFTTMPTNRVSRFEAEQFRVLLLRRLRLPLPLSVRSCRCALGHHRAACSRSGVLGRRGFAAESAVAPT